jgi:hypothetical protein
MTSIFGFRRRLSPPSVSASFHLRLLQSVGASPSPLLFDTVGHLCRRRRPLSKAAVDTNFIAPLVFPPHRRPDSPVSPRHPLLARGTPHVLLLLASAAAPRLGC